MKTNGHDSGISAMLAYESWIERAENTASGLFESDRGGTYFLKVVIDLPP
jgi:hypothetical protein